MENKKRIGIKTIFTQATLLPVLFLGIISILLVTLRFYQFANDSTEQKLEENAKVVLGAYESVYDNTYTAKESMLYLGDKSADSLLEINDQSAKYSFCAGDKRVKTTIPNAQGTYLNEEIYNVLKTTGEPHYASGLNINGSSFSGYYIPLFNESHNLVGVFELIAPRVDTLRYMAGMVMPVLATVLVILIIAGTISYMFSRKMSGYIIELNAFIQNLTENEFHKKISEDLYNRDDELGDIGQNLVLMRNTLRDLLELDPLTKLYNRRAGEKRLNGIRVKARHGNKKYAFAIGDIDFFKKVNDTYGHEAGDEVLKAVAKIIKAGMKKDGFVARWGGEEFMIVFEAKTGIAAAKHLEKILNQIRQTEVEFEGQIIKVTMTFGVVTCSPDIHPERLFAKADRKLYYGKQHGRNQVVLNMTEGEESNA